MVSAAFSILAVVFFGMDFFCSVAPVVASPQPMTERVALVSGEVPSYPGGREVRAIAQAFPSRVQAHAVRDEQWALKVDDTWYAFAEGRFLPYAEREHWEEYVALRFYRYTIGAWRKPIITPPLEARLRAITEARNTDETIRYNGFLDDLYQIHSQREAEQRVREVRFLGYTTRVHPLVVAPLSRVADRVREAIATDTATRRFFDHIAHVQGYHWRNIAGTKRRSYHAYGMAVDLTPAHWRGGWAYWKWAADAGESEWWLLDEQSRWFVPQPVIDAFEAEGFVWGGKWLLFDNMHFEYRPEVLALSDR